MLPIRPQNMDKCRYAIHGSFVRWGGSNPWPQTADSSHPRLRCTGRGRESPGHRTTTMSSRFQSHHEEESGASPDHHKLPFQSHDKEESGASDRDHHEWRFQSHCLLIFSCIFVFFIFCRGLRYFLYFFFG